ncbi:Peptidase S8 family protein [Granulibacter bethesdensis CGDNIH4]|nr:Peptidase S8 family protein [Granulibacter bethesdensis CGDNIH4]
MMQAMANNPNDPLFKYQWGLLNTGQFVGYSPGMDINVLPLWGEYTGAGVRVAVADTGLQLDHPDFAGRVDTAKSWDAVSDKAGGGPVKTDDNHGTAVAGVIGAGMNDGIGGTGVAPGVTLLSLRVLGDESSEERDSDTTARATTIGFSKALLSNIDVLNNSWSPSAPKIGPGAKPVFAINWTDGQNPQSFAIASLATYGRQGQGTIVVFSNGNARKYDDDGNLNNNTNSRFTIAVAAINGNGQYSSYSSAGANLLISAPGSQGGNRSSPTGGIVTSDRTSSDGYNKTEGVAGDYNYGFNGTSAAAPFVSGVAALMLQANPTLGYRDVQQIMAYTARKNDASNPSWVTTGANNSNGGSLHFSRDYGFGLIDAHAAVRVAESYGTLTAYDVNGFSKNEFNVVKQSTNFSPVAPATIAAGHSYSFYLGYTQAISVEHIDLLLSLTAADTSALKITLSSPSGTSVDLVSQTPNVSQESANIPWPGSFSLGSFAFMGEKSNVVSSSGQTNGRWYVTILNQGSSDISFNSGKLALSGSNYAQTSFVYTDDYATQVASNPNRAYAIVNAADSKVIMNASAVTGAVSSDLPNNRITINGVQTYVSTTTTAPPPDFHPSINAFLSGDGNDTLTGGTDQLLAPGRGDNTVYLVGKTGMVQSIGKDTITAFQGAATVQASGNAIIFSNTSRLNFVGTGGASTIVAGAGPVSVTGGSAKVTVFGSSGGNDTMIGGSVGSNQLAANGTGTTIFGKSGDSVLYGSNTGASTLITAGGNNTVFGGSGGSTIFSNGSHDLIVMDQGASTLFGGQDAAIFTNSANASIVGGTSSIAIGFGNGTSTAWSSGATDLFLFANGLAGGNVTINNFQIGKDFIQLSGYGSNGIQTALDNAAHSESGLSMTLSDNTRITLTGIDTLDSDSFMT